MRRTAPIHTLGALALLWASGCAVNPATGEREISFVSESQEVQIGRESDPVITAQMGGPYPDDELQRYVTNLGNTLAQASERPGLPWTFKVLDDDLINAFALPGGWIYVTRGILSYMNSEAELVGVLGHEVGHVTARHTASRITRQQLGIGAVVVGAVFSETVRANADVALMGLQLMMLRYSRADESQSDALGYRYMTRVNYNPAGISQVMAMLQSTSPSSEEMGIPTWMLSHPDPGNRVAANEERLSRDRAAGLGYDDFTIAREPFLDRIDGMTFGPDPNQGYFIGTRFLHPVLEFELTFPEGWAVQNGAQAVQGSSREQDAILALSFSSESSARAAMDAFMSQEGVSRIRVYDRSNDGIQTLVGDFTAATEQGNLAGSILFAEYGGQIYQIVGYAPTRSWSDRRPVVDQALRTFRRLDDPRLLDVSPHRIDVVRLPREMTFRQFLERYPSTVDEEQVALANQVDPGDTLEAGRLMKRITGGRVPTG